MSLLMQCYSSGSAADRVHDLQLMEDLEQLKVLENGYKIKVIVVEHEAHGVDEPEDVVKIEEKMRKLGLPSRAAALVH